MKIDIEILSPQSGKKPEQLRRRLQIFTKELLSGLPFRWGTSEPLSHASRNGHFDDMVPELPPVTDIFLKARDFSGSFCVAKHVSIGDVHSSIDFSLDSKVFPQHKVLTFIKKMAVETHAEFAFVDLWLPDDQESGICSGAASYGRYYIATHTLRQSIPRVFWCFVLGKPYVDLIGESCIKSSPAFAVEELSSGQFLIQLTSSLNDVVHNRPLFQQMQEDVMTHLGPQYFFRNEICSEHEAPIFQIDLSTI